MTNNYQVGDKIRFEAEKRPYTVRARSERFLVCTKPFNVRKTVLYTVVDFQEDIRGTENLVFGAGAETDEDCQQMIQRLTTGDPEDQFFKTEVSRRNRVPLDIVE